MDICCRLFCFALQFDFRLKKLRDVFFWGGGGGGLGRERRKEKKVAKVHGKHAGSLFQAHPETERDIGVVETLSDFGEGVSHQVRPLGLSYILS